MTSMLPFRFGVISTGRPSGSEWCDLARELENLGYDILHVPQHFSIRSPPPVPALSIAATVTNTLRLGTLVVDNEAQHPAVIARDAGWLADISDGRFELGIGAGWLAADHQVLGEPWRAPAERVSRLDEALTLIRACWAGEPISFTGAHYRVDGLLNGTVIGSPPPVLVGGGGPRVLSVAARHAEVVGIAPDMRTGRIGKEAARTMNREQVMVKAARAQAAATHADQLELHMTITAVHDGNDPDALRRTAEAFGMPCSRLVDVPSVLVGSASDMVDQLRALRKDTGVSYISVPEAAYRRLAPVVAELRGT